jgi:hypothetical protein
MNSLEIEFCIECAKLSEDSMQFFKREAIEFFHNIIV